jgi:hypothetical protein
MLSRWKTIEWGTLRTTEQDDIRTRRSAEILETSGWYHAEPLGPLVFESAILRQTS